MEVSVCGGNGKCQLTIEKMEAVVPLRNKELNYEFLSAVWLTITKGKREEL